jgi:hypothetical protein
MVQMSVAINVTETGKNVPEYRLQSDLGGEITFAQLLQFTKSALLTISRDVLREEQAKGFPRDPLVIVDNRKGKPVEQVNPLGKIEFVAQQDLREIAIFIMQAIQKRSPIVTGLYASQNLVFFNSIQIASNVAELEAWFDKGQVFEERDRLRFLNAAPYAQKLERYGVSAGRQKIATRKSKDKKLRSGERVLKPNGTYALAARSARGKFRKNAFIKFELLPGSYLGITTPLPPNLKQKFRAYFSPNSKYNQGTYIYPTILLGVEKAGILQ